MLFWSVKVRFPVLAVMLCAAVPLAMEAQQARPALPRLEGKPSLEGIWKAQSRAAYDLQYHPARYGMPAPRFARSFFNWLRNGWA